MFKGLKALLAGVVAGTLVGVLFAPKKGKDIRKDLKKEIDQGGLGVDTLKGVVSEMGKDMGEAGHKVYEDVSKTEGYKKAKKEIVKHAKAAKKVAKELVEENIPARTRKEAKKTFLHAKSKIEKFSARAKKGLHKVASKVAEKSGKHE
jgi:gas vesicle protein